MPLWDLLWAMVWFFVFILWIWLVITIFVDLFRADALRPKNTSNAVSKAT